MSYSRGWWKRDTTRHADGTTNFVHGFPYACISLGLIDQRVPVLGVIYNPFLEHLYTGVRGAGSFLHTRASPDSPSTTTTNNNNSATTTTPPPPPQRLPLAPASARPLPTLAGALVAIEWGSDRGREPIRRKADSFSRLAGAPPHGVMAHSLRSVGSAALNFALVAQGALDMYWYVPCARALRPSKKRYFFLIGVSCLSSVFFFLEKKLTGCREIGCWYVLLQCLSINAECLWYYWGRLARPWDVCVRSPSSTP
jgi:hypothetical protein